MTGLLATGGGPFTLEALLLLAAVGAAALAAVAVLIGGTRPRT